MLTSSIRAAHTQAANLNAMQTSARMSAVRDKSLARLQATVEDALAGIREELLNMENVVAALRTLLFSVDLLLAQPENALQYAGNPTEALQTIGAQFDSFSAELIEKREVSGPVRLVDDDFILISSDSAPVRVYVRRNQRR